MTFKISSLIWAKGFVATIVFLLLTHNAIGQVHMDYLEASKTKDFDEIVAKTEAYFKDKEKGSGTDISNLSVGSILTPLD